MAMKQSTFLHQRMFCTVGTPYVFGYLPSKFKLTLFNNLQARLKSKILSKNSYVLASPDLYRFTKKENGFVRIERSTSTCNWLSHRNSYFMKSIEKPGFHQRRSYRVTKRLRYAEFSKPLACSLCLAENKTDGQIDDCLISTADNLRINRYERMNKNDIDHVKQLLMDIFESKRDKARSIEKTTNDPNSYRIDQVLGGDLVCHPQCGDDISETHQEVNPNFNFSTIGVGVDEDLINIRPTGETNRLYWHGTTLQLNQLESHLPQGVVLSSLPAKADCSPQEDVGKSQDSDGKRPMNEHLAVMHERLSVEMPEFFEHSHDYTMYSPDVKFDNRIMNVKTRGLSAYKATVQSLKYFSTAFLANAHLEVMRLTIHPEDNSIQARWRVKGVPIHSYMLCPFSKKHGYRYFDAFSIFYLGDDGLIHIHRLDKFMPDSQKEKTPSLMTRLGIALGLVRSPNLDPNWMDSKQACKISLKS